LFHKNIADKGKTSGLKKSPHKLVSLNFLYIKVLPLHFQNIINNNRPWGQKQKNMSINRTQKEAKAILKVFQNSSISGIKEYLEGGFDPNEIFTVKFGNIYDSNNPCTMYDIALWVPIWRLSFIAETKQVKELQDSLEVVKLLTPLIKSAYPLEDSRSYTRRALPVGFDRLDLGSATKYKKTGMYDALIEAMLETGYDFAHDKDVFWTIGMFSLDTAKKVLDLTGLDDGASVFSAAECHNVELTMYLLKEGVSPNKPFVYSTGNMTTALHEMIVFGELETVRALLDAGADITVKNQYNEDCLETARSYRDIREAGREILDLLEKA
jgi:hypothetical protein